MILISLVVACVTAGESSLTIYNADFAVVRERLPLDLKQGTNEVRVVEHLYRWSTWEIAEKSDPFTKTDSQTIEFRVQVPAGQEKIVTYRAHYTW